MSFRACSLLLLLTLFSLAQAEETTKGVPPAQAPFSPPKSGAPPNTTAYMKQKMSTIIFPHVQFQGATIEQAIDFLRTKSREFDTSPGPPGEKGMNLILRTGGAPTKTSISLDLKDVPLSEALRYVTELAQMKYRLEQQAILIVPASAAFGEIDLALHTRTFPVPSDFLDRGVSSNRTPDTSEDPFATPPPKPAPADSSTPRPTSVQQMLESAGIAFPEGARASFNPITDLLTVTNTQQNLDLIEAFVEFVQNNAPANAAFTLTVIEGPGDLIRQANSAASKSADASKELASLHDLAKNPGYNVRIVGEAFFESKPGVRSTVESVLDPTLTNKREPDSKSSPSVAKESPHIVIQLEIEPHVSADKTTITTPLSFSLNTTRAAQPHPSVNDPAGVGSTAASPATGISGTQINASISIKAGATKLICVTKPTGLPQENADVLCAAFLTATPRRVDPLPMPQPKAAAPSSVPSGMIFATLHLPERFFEEFLQPNPPSSAQTWLAQEGIPSPPGSSIEQRDGMLRLINTPDNIADIAAAIERRLNMAPATVACSLHTLEAPAPFLRDLVHQTLASTDDSAMFAALEAAVARGEARFIHSASLSGKSGTRATHHAAREHQYLTSIKIDAQGRPVPSFETRLVGAILGIEATIGADSRTVDLVFSHELHPTVPVIRRERFRDPASQQSFDLPVSDFHYHKTSSSILLTKGSTKLISLNPPTGLDKPDMLWATFLKCDVVPTFKERRKAAPVQPPKSATSPQPEKMIVRRFGAEEIYPDLFYQSGQSARLFLPNPRQSTNGLVTAKVRSHESLQEERQESLESAGVLFPPGSYIRLLGDRASFIARNTPENLAKIPATFPGRASPTTPVFTLHVLQAPGPLLRRIIAQAATKSDHSAELNELLAAVKSGAVQSLDISHIETRSGSRAKTREGAGHRPQFQVPAYKEATSKITPENRTIGLTLELEPVIGADGTIVELTLAPEFHTAPPFEHREHVIDTQGRRLEFPLTDYFTAKLTTGITMPDGTARLISLYKPTGKPEFETEDVLQAIFITCDILRAGE